MNSTEMNVTILPPNEAALTTEAEAFLTKAKAIQVTNADEADHATAVLKSIKARKDELESQRKTITKPLDDAKKAIMNLFRVPTDTLARGEQIIKSTLIGYREAEERRAREARAKAEAAARKEREALEARAAKAQERGREEKAEALRDIAAQTVAPPAAAYEPAKVEGVQMRQTWDFDVEDKMALIKAVAAGQVPPVALEVNTKFLREQARSLKEHFSIPGVRAFAKKSIAA